MERAETVPTAFAEAVNPRGLARCESGARGDKIRIEQHSATGLLWFAGWLFTIGFLHLSFWKGVLALFVWPYYVGTAVGTLLAR